MGHHGLTARWEEGPLYDSKEVFQELVMGRESGGKPVIVLLNAKV